MSPLFSSLRFRFALGAVGLATVVVALFATGTFLHIREEQFEAVDLELMAEARHLSDTHRDSPSSAVISYQPWISFALQDAQGHVIQKSAKLPPALLQETLGDPPARPRTLHSADASWRIAVYPLDTVNGRHRLVLGYDLKEVYEILDEMLVAYLVGTLLVLALSALGGAWLSGRMLAPVARLTAAAEAIDIHGLDQRVPVPPAHDELQRLALRLNAMLERIEQGVGQARRFSADASHELRTPLTIMRGELDRLLHSGSLPPEHEARVLRLQEATARLQRITETLLLLARLDSGAAASQHAPLDFSALVLETGEDAALLAEGRTIRLEFDMPPGLFVKGDPEQLRRLVLNLLDNAIRYNHPGGHVTCRLALTAADRVELRVANPGPGLPEELRTRLFERFSRGDPAHGVGGHGLGLALAREIARAHGGELRLASPSGTMLTEFVFILAAAK